VTAPSPLVAWAGPIEMDRTYECYLRAPSTGGAKR